MPNKYTEKREIIESALAEALGQPVRVHEVYPGQENIVARVTLEGQEVVCRLSTRRSLASVEAEQELVAYLGAAGIRVASPSHLFAGKSAISTGCGVLSANVHITGEAREEEGWFGFQEIVRELGSLVRTSARLGWVKNRSTRPFKREVLDEAPDLVSHYTASDSERATLSSQIHSLYEPGNNGIAVHGDIHRNNVLWKLGEEGAVLAAIVDFDDCYNGCIADELYSFMRGYCYVGTNLDRARISYVSDEFRLIWRERDILYRLAAECVYFYFAISDSYSKKRGAKKSDLEKELRKVKAAVELARIVD